ncbi:MAG: preprotein translocase subunit SecE [Alphaproteobacteria bacterium]
MATKTSPAQFIRQVRQEFDKITWPTRRETMVTTIMVFIMVIVASLFFLIADQIIAWLVKFVLGIGG